MRSSQVLAALPLGSRRPCSSSAPAENDDKVRLLREKHRQLQEAARPVLIGLQEVLQASGSIIMLSPIRAAPSSTCTATRAPRRGRA